MQFGVRYGPQLPMTIGDIAGLKVEEEAHRACHSVYPVKQIVWVNIGTCADAGKYETNLKVRSEDYVGLHIRFLMWRLRIPLMLVCLF